MDENLARRPVPGLFRFWVYHLTVGMLVQFVRLRHTSEERYSVWLPYVKRLAFPILGGTAAGLWAEAKTDDLLSLWWAAPCCYVLAVLQSAYLAFRHSESGRRRLLEIRSKEIDAVEGVATTVNDFVTDPNELWIDKGKVADLLNEIAPILVETFCERDTDRILRAAGFAGGRHTVISVIMENKGRLAELVEILMQQAELLREALRRDGS